MRSFNEWRNTIGTEDVDESQIDSAYDKAKLAVQLVRMYDNTLPEGKKLLLNISTIANLSSGAYGLYASSENKRIIGQDVVQKIRFKFGDDFLQKHRIQDIPRKIIRQYVPDIPPKAIQPSDVIHVNVRRIVSELGDTINAVLEVASTIVHEATHELERAETGTTSEAGPVAAERAFTNWARMNMPAILQHIPQLRNIPASKMRAY